MSPVIEKSIFGMAGMGLARHHIYNIGTKIAARAMKILADKDGFIRRNHHIPVMQNWMQSRDLPVLKKEKFRDWFKKHQKEK